MTLRTLLLSVALSIALTGAIAAQDPGSPNGGSEPVDPRKMSGEEFKAAVQAVRATLDGNDTSVDGEGRGGWTWRDLPEQQRLAFREMTDDERAEVYVYPLDQAVKLMTEQAIEPEALLGFDMQVEWIRRGRRVTGIRAWGRCKPVDKLFVSTRVRYPDTEALPLLIRKTTVNDNGTWEIVLDLKRRKLRRGYYIITGIADPRLSPDAGDYVREFITDRAGREVPLIETEFERRTLQFGTDDEIAAEELQLSRFYIDVLEENLLPLHVELHERAAEYYEGRGVHEVIPEAEGPVQPEPILVFDPSEWRAFLDEDLMPFIVANRDAVRDMREGYLAARYPNYINGLVVALRDLEGIARAKSVALYKHWNLQPAPQDVMPGSPVMQSEAQWQRRFDRDVLALRKMGLRPLSVKAKEYAFLDLLGEGAELPERLPVPTRE